MTVVRALSQPYNQLGRQLGLLIAKTCRQYGLNDAEGVCEMFINVYGNEDLSSPSDFIDVGRTLDHFVYIVGLSVYQFSPILN